MESKAPTRILVVDDEKEFCSIISEFFSEEGYTVRVAHTGKEALAVLKEFNADVILLDKKMPQMDGLECLVKIKNITASPVIIISGSISAKGKETCLNLGAYDFISKPINLDNVLEKIQSALNNNE